MFSQNIITEKLKQNRANSCRGIWSAVKTLRGRGKLYANQRISCRQNKRATNNRQKSSLEKLKDEVRLYKPPPSPLNVERDQRERPERNAQSCHMAATSSQRESKRMHTNHLQVTAEPPSSLFWVILYRDGSSSKSRAHRDTPTSSREKGLPIVWGV